jgi:transposase InsO family protein
LTACVARVFEESKGRYGSPKVHEALEKQGNKCSKNTVAKIMLENNLKARVNRVYVRNPGLHRFFKRIDNLRLGKPEPQRMNQVWVGDVTYIKVKSSFQYLAAVMDLYSRRLIGWSLGSNRKGELTERALFNALRKRRPEEGLIFHSDRGIEYCANRYHELLGKHGIVPSVNRPGHCQDNAHMESFFHTLKGELIRNTPIADAKELKNLLKGYITHFYNTKRLHSGINYYSPVEYEALAR